MTNETYNGWTNRETWLIYLWANDHLAEHAKDNGQTLSAQDVEFFINDWLEITSPSGLGIDLLNHALGQVNWQEIADAANE